MGALGSSAPLRPLAGRALFVGVRPALVDGPWARARRSRALGSRRRRGGSRSEEGGSWSEEARERSRERGGAGEEPGARRV